MSPSPLLSSVLLRIDREVVLPYWSKSFIVIVDVVSPNPRSLLSTSVAIRNPSASEANADDAIATARLVNIDIAMFFMFLTFNLSQADEFSKLEEASLSSSFFLSNIIKRAGKSVKSAINAIKSAIAVKLAIALFKPKLDCAKLANPATSIIVVIKSAVPTPVKAETTADLASALAAFLAI
jgi:hypothetical protein